MAAQLLQCEACVQIGWPHRHFPNSMKKIRIFIGTLAAMGALLASQMTYAQTWVPTGGGTFSWNEDGNWNTAPFPNLTGANANVSADIVAPTQIDLNIPITVGSLTLNDTGGTGDSAYTIATGTSGSLNFQVASGSASLTSAGATNSISAPISFTSPTTITVTNSLNLSGNLSGSGIITRSSSAGATLAVTGDNSGFAGSWVLNSGNQNAITSFNSDVAAGAVPGAAMIAIRNTAANSNLNLNFTGALHANRGIQLDATMHIGGNGSFTTAIDGKITGTGGLNKSGNGNSIIVLSNASNDFSGAVNISAGTLSIASFGALGANSSVTFGNGGSTGGGTLIYTGAGATTSKAIRLSSAVGSGNNSSARINNNGTGALDLTDTGNVVSASAAGARILTLGGSNTGNNMFRGLVNANGTGSVVVEKRDAGTWFLTNESNSYLGATRVYGGILDVTSIKDGGVVSSIGASSNGAGSLLLTSGGVLRYSGAGDTTDRLFQIGDSSGSPLTGTISSSGSGALVFTNTGTITFGTTNQARTVILSGTNAGNNTLAASIGNNGTSSVGLTKSGAGKWVLTGSHVYTGATGVTGGTLVVNGSLGSTTVTVGSGAFLGGSGSIGGAVNVSAGGTVAPGNSPGQLDTGNFTLSSSTSTLSLELGKATAGSPPIGGSDHDQLNVTGTVSLGGGNLALTIDSGLEVNDLLFAILNDGAEGVSGVFGSINGVTTTLTQGTMFSLGGYDFQISYLANSTGGTFLGGNDVALQVIAVPEPASALLLSAGAGLLLVLRRRRSAMV